MHQKQGEGSHNINREIFMECWFPCCFKIKTNILWSWSLNFLVKLYRKWGHTNISYLQHLLTATPLDHPGWELPLLCMLRAFWWNSLGRIALEFVSPHSIVGWIRWDDQCKTPHTGLAHRKCSVHVRSLCCPHSTEHCETSMGFGAKQNRVSTLAHHLFAGVSLHAILCIRMSVPGVRCLSIPLWGFFPIPN